MTTHFDINKWIGHPPGITIQTMWPDTIVGKVENGRVFFAVRGQTNGLSQFKVDSICLSMLPHCGSFSIRPCGPLPYAKLSGTNPEIGTCRGNFSINKLL